MELWKLEKEQKNKRRRVEGGGVPIIRGRQPEREFPVLPLALGVV